MKWCAAYAGNSCQARSPARVPFGNQCAWSGGLPGGARLRLKRQQSHRPLTPAFKKRCTLVRIGQGFFQLRQAYRQMRQFVVFAGVFVAYLRNNSCINLLVRQFFSLECCDKQNQLIYGETRRSTENCFFVRGGRGGTRRTARAYGIFFAQLRQPSMMAADRPLCDQPQFAPGNCSYLSYCCRDRASFGCLRPAR